MGNSNPPRKPEEAAFEHGIPPATLFVSQHDDEHTKTSPVVIDTAEGGPAAANHEPPSRPIALAHEQEQTNQEYKPEVELEIQSNDRLRPGATVSEKSERQTAADHELPDERELVTVEEAVVLFREAGLPRHIRTIQKYCARQSGRALVCHQTPTENGIRYLIEKTSIDRFIADAAQQAPTGTLKTADAPITSSGKKIESSKPFVASSDLMIFDHPYVKRLEERIERLDDKNDRLQGEVKNVLEQANERLVELQKANAVAQSESLGTFLLEAERIRRLTDDDNAPHPSPSGPNIGRYPDSPTDKQSSRDNDSKSFLSGV